MMRAETNHIGLVRFSHQGAELVAVVLGLVLALWLPSLRVAVHFKILVIAGDVGCGYAGLYLELCQFSYYLFIRQRQSCAYSPEESVRCLLALRVRIVIMVVLFYLDFAFFVIFLWIR